MRYFTGFLIAIGLIILIFVIILKGGGSKAPSLNLNSYANSDATIQLTIDGPITADQTHQQIQIAISPTDSGIEMLQGYQGSVTNSKTYLNNQNAYSVFIHALANTGFTKGVSSTNLDSEVGACSSGERYIFTLTEGGSTVAEYWSTSCGGGTFGGNINVAMNLFEQQIPDFSTITQNFIY
jgi:hypothetical protein